MSKRKLAAPIRDAILLDSNLLLLWIVGLINPAIIGTHKRTQSFSVTDFRLVHAYIGTYRRVLTTPHVLAEVSNLAGAATGALRERLMWQLCTLVQTFEERTPTAVHLCSKPETKVFGLTDAALAEIAQNTVLLTADGRLAKHLQLSGMIALTLADLRAFAVGNPH